jgi:hypothetical protein
VKTHKTFRVTAEVLHGSPTYACGSGVAAIAALLPCEISTDPEENYDIATELIALGQGYRAMWLCCTFPYNESPPNDVGVHEDYWFCTSADCCVERVIAKDVFVIAQQLAMYADRMLTRKGK